MLTSSLKRHILRISLFAGALIQSREGIVYFLSIVEGSFLSQDDLIGAPVTKNVVHLLRV